MIQILCSLYTLHWLPLISTLYIAMGERYKSTVTIISGTIDTVEELIIKYALRTSYWEVWLHEVAFEISSLRNESKTWDSFVCVRCSLCLVDVKIRDDKSLLFRTWKESVRGARRAHADGNAEWGAERRLIQLRWLRKVVSFAQNWRRSRSIGHFTSLIIGADTAWNALLYSSIIILSMRFAGLIIFYKGSPIVSHVYGRWIIVLLNRSYIYQFFTRYLRKCSKVFNQLSNNRILQ